MEQDQRSVMLSGKSLFMVTYTSHADGAVITMAYSFPGSIIEADISNRAGLFLTKLTGPGKVWLQTITMPGFA